MGQDETEGRRLADDGTAPGRMGLMRRMRRVRIDTTTREQRDFLANDNDLSREVVNDRLLSLR